MVGAWGECEDTEKPPRLLHAEHFEEIAKHQLEVRQRSASAPLPHPNARTLMCRNWRTRRTRRKARTATVTTSREGREGSRVRRSTGRVSVTVQTNNFMLAEISCARSFICENVRSRACDVSVEEERSA